MSSDSAPLDRLAQMQLSPSSVANDEASSTSAAPQISLPAPLVALVERFSAQPHLAPMQRIFTDLARMLDYLRLIEHKVRQDRLLVATMSVFFRLQAETCALIAFIDGEAQRQLRADEVLAGALDGVSYAIAHEVKRVFEVELIGLDELSNTSFIRARLEHAYGLLHNAIQQSLIVLAQVFEPTLIGEELFDDFARRRQHSLKLYRELDQLLQLAHHVAATGDQRAVALLLARLTLFRDDSMCHLMYRDWNEYESFISELRAAQSRFELATVLNSLTCYLETLLSQVRMRSALADCNLDVIVPVSQNSRQ
ncbi:MAG TPA: hypothetical protein VE821_06735 [Pyrinomonadaceae bacterium]|nr:hypothetical protein [Pyrinomonadaceae bacterium]